MTRYETTSQWASARTRRRVGLVGMALMLGLGTDLLLKFLLSGDYQTTSTGSVTLLASLFLYAFSIIPISLAVGNRPHPTSIEVTDEALTLNFSGGRVERLAWGPGTVDQALDTRTADPDRRRRPGLEVTLWVPVAGRDPGAVALRPQQLIVSVHAFNEIRRRVLGAGFREVPEMTRKGGTFLRYEKDPEGGDPAGTGKADHRT